MVAFICSLICFLWFVSPLFQSSFLSLIFRMPFLVPSILFLDYPNTSVIAKFGLMPKPRPTIASESVAMAREQQRAKEYSTKKKFVMKKFQNIEGVALKNFTKVGKGPGKSTTLSTEDPTTDDA